MSASTQLQCRFGRDAISGLLRKLHFQVLISLLATILASCGGGGGGGSTASPATPYIFATVSSFASDNVPSGLLAIGSNSLVSILVLNDADNTAISSASAKVNGVHLGYSTSSQDYWAYMNLDPGKPIVIEVTVNGTTYTTTTNQFAAPPTLNMPSSGDWWYSGDVNNLTWQGDATGSETYALMLVSANGDIVWPQNGNMQVLSASTSSTTISRGAVHQGDYYALVGKRKVVAFQGATSQSGIAVRAFATAPVSVFDTPYYLRSINITRSSDSLAVGDSAQLKATGTYDNGRTRDITSSLTWSTWNSGVASVASSGVMTGLTVGQTTVQAADIKTNTFTNFVLNVYRKTSTTLTSPPSPLSQSVAYQVDPSHSGVAAFNAPLVFPATPTWTATLNGVTSYPLIAAGKVFVVTGASAVTSDRGASLYALDEQTGAILWGPVDIPGSAPGKWGAHAYDNGLIFVRGSDGVLRSFNATNGNPVWFVSAAYSSLADSGPPVAKNGIVYSSSIGGIAAYEQASGVLLWSRSYSGADGQMPTVADDGLAISNGCSVVKFDLRTGAALWSASGPCSSGSSNQTAYANGRVFSAGINSAASGIFNAANGDLIRRLGTTTVPAATSSTAYQLDHGQLTGINLDTGVGQWSFAGDGALNSLPLLINQTVVIASASGNVYALDATNGSLIWTGNAGQAIRAPYYFDIYPTAGMGAGDGYLVVSAGNSLTAWRIASH